MTTGDLGNVRHYKNKNSVYIKKKKETREETLKDTHENNMHPCFRKNRITISYWFHDFFFFFYYVFF